MILAVCLAVVLVLVGIALLVAAVGSPAPDTVAFEFRKYLIQFLLIVALGAVVAFLVEEVKRGAERREKERQEQRGTDDRKRQYAIDTLTSLLERLDAVYRTVKRERRLLRLLRITDLTKKAYMEAMGRLSEAKEDVEKLWRDMEVLGRWLPELKSVGPSVKDMEDYLDLLENEWERVGPLQDEVFSKEDLKALKGFRAKWSEPESNFDMFRAPYYAARQELITRLANRRGVDPLVAQ